MKKTTRRGIWGALVLLLLGLGYAASATGVLAPTSTASSPSTTPTGPTTATASPAAIASPDDGLGPAVGARHPCPASFAAHVYHPDRLALLAPCVTVGGVVEVIRHEADGDWHVLFKTDPAYGTLTNSVNVSAQHGDLVIEPTCVGAVSQADAVLPCQGASPPIGFQLIQVGAHLLVTGPYVNDQQHGWNEIHPVVFVEPAL